MESKPRFPQSLEIAARFPHSHQAGGEADGKVENQKQVSHFPTARLSPLKNELARLSASPFRLQITSTIDREFYLSPNGKIRDRDQRDVFSAEVYDFLLVATTPSFNVTMLLASPPSAYLELR
jgi:hypothetical protein